jgi:LmbE family N-acetylglucosaminyl deacetylase
MNKVLVVCAHPDDETLGVGATLALHIAKNDDVQVLIFSEGETARGKKNSKISMRQKQTHNACKILGIKKIKFLQYPDQKLDSVPISELSKQVEQVIKQYSPNIVYTHYWDDVNQDHRQVFEATSIAVRPVPKSKISKFFVFDTPSSTEWNSKNSSFTPNIFVDIKKTLPKKLKAFNQYEHEVMKYPHPRSLESIKNRAKYWGNSVGLEFAEPFILIREFLKF